MRTTLNEQTMLDLDSLPSISATKVSDTKEEKISATKYMNQYKKEKYDTIRIDFKKGSKQLLQAEASKRGMSLTQMIKESLKQYLGVSA